MFFCLYRINVSILVWHEGESWMIYFKLYFIKPVYWSLLVDSVRCRLFFSRLSPSSLPRVLFCIQICALWFAGRWPGFHVSPAVASPSVSQRSDWTTDKHVIVDHPSILKLIIYIVHFGFNVRVTSLLVLNPTTFCTTQSTLWPNSKFKPQPGNPSSQVHD